MNPQPASTERELTAIFQNWQARGLTWDDIGNCTPEDLEAFKKVWFPDDPVSRAKLQSIWVRHPNRQGQPVQAAVAGMLTSGMVFVF
jgi:hypothetical protein